jgi:hypothetical protein
MRPFLVLFPVLFAANAAFGQAVTIPITTPAPAAPAQAPNASDQLMRQLQNALHSKDQGQALQQGIAIAGLLGCTSKTAGKPATDAYYRRTQDIGKQVEALCKAKRPDDARALVLTTITADQANDVVIAMNRCYDSNKENFDMMAGPELAHDSENYARWLRDPTLARSEMRNEDICR